MYAVVQNFSGIDRLNLSTPQRPKTKGLGSISQSSQPWLPLHPDTQCVIHPQCVKFRNTNVKALTAAIERTLETKISYLTIFHTVVVSVFTDALHAHLVKYSGRDVHESRLPTVIPRKTMSQSINSCNKACNNFWKAGLARFMFHRRFKVVCSIDFYSHTARVLQRVDFAFDSSFVLVPQTVKL